MPEPEQHNNAICFKNDDIGNDNVNTKSVFLRVFNTNRNNNKQKDNHATRSQQGNVL
jgi:hypothetical protein